MIGASLCLAMAIYYEAGTEKEYDAGIAVAEVILNRVADPRFPDNVCGVIKEDKGPTAYDCQFSFYCDGKPEKPYQGQNWRRAKEQAADALNGFTLGHNALFYHAYYASPVWRHAMRPVGRIGSHIFYTDRKEEN